MRSVEESLEDEVDEALSDWSVCERLIPPPVTCCGLDGSAGECVAAISAAVMAATAASRSALLGTYLDCKSKSSWFGVAASSCLVELAMSLEHEEEVASGEELPPRCGRAERMLAVIGILLLCALRFRRYYSQQSVQINKCTSRMNGIVLRG